MAARAQDAKWQTVKAKDDRKQKPKKAPEQALPSQQQAIRAFATIDSDAELIGPRGGPASTSAPSRTAFASLETDSPPPSPVAAPTPAPVERQPPRTKAANKPVKPKKPSARQEAQTPASVQLHINTGDLRQLLRDTAEKYKSDQLSQLETIADFFVRSLKDSDAGLAKLNRERSWHKATDTPYAELSEDARSPALQYLAGIQPQTASQFQLKLVDAVLAGHTDGKGKGSQPRIQIGVLAMLALLARASPDSMTLLAQHLLSRASHYCSPAHLSFLLWTFAQAARANIGVGLAMWLRVLLPVLMGSPAAPASHENNHGAANSTAADVQLSAAGNEAALSLLDELLSRDKPDKKGKGLQISGKLLESARVGIHSQGPDQQPEPVIPPAALEAIIRPDAKGTRGCPPVVRVMLINQHDRLLQLALAGIKSGGYSVAEAVRLALETAALSEAPLEGSQDAVAHEAASHLAAYLLAAFPATAAAWKSRHKHQLRGSARVLQCWLGRKSDPAIKDLQRRKEFRPFLEELRQRHASTLGGGRKGTHGRGVAAAAEAACTGLLAKSKVVKGTSAAAASRSWTPLVLLVLAVAIAAAALGLSRLDGAQEYVQRLKSTRAAQSLAALADKTYASSAQTFAPLQAQLGSYLTPAAGSTKGSLGHANSQLAPLLNSLQEESSRLVHQASAFLGPYAQQVSARVSALVHWHSVE